MNKYLKKYALSDIRDNTGTTTTEDKVIVEDLSGVEPPVVVYQHDIKETLEPFADVAEDENYRDFHIEIQEAWDNNRPWAKTFAEAIGVRITRLDPRHYDERGRVGQVLQDMSEALSIPEVAEVLGVTRTTVYRWVKGEGVSVPLPAMKLGSHYRINSEELEAWVMDNR